MEIGIRDVRIATAIGELAGEIVAGARSRTGKLPEVLAQDIEDAVVVRVDHDAMMHEAIASIHIVTLVNGDVRQSDCPSR